MEIIILEFIMVFPAIVLFLLCKWNFENNTGKIFFKLAIIFIICVMVTESVSNFILLKFGSSFSHISFILNELFFIFEVLFPFTLFYINVYQKKSKKLNIISFASLAIYLIFLILNIKTHAIFDITYNNEYIRGPYNFISLFPAIYGLLFIKMELNLLHVFSNHERFLLKCSLALGLGGLIIQIVFHITIEWIMICLALMIYYQFLCQTQLNFDKLTNSENRNNFFIRVKQFSDLDVVWIITIDVNCLKYINDNLGHASGDELLCSVSKSLQDTFKSYGIVSRIGGDEFCILCPNAFLSHSKIDELMLKAEEMNKYWHEHIPVNCLISYGKSCYNGPDSKKSIMQTLKDADDEMYRMKRRVEGNSFRK